MEQLLATVYFAGIIVEMVIRLPLNRRRVRQPKAERRVTPAEAAVLLLLFLGMFLIPLVHALTPWLGFADYGWPPAAAALAGGVGAILLAASVWLF